MQGRFCKNRLAGLGQAAHWAGLPLTARWAACAHRIGTFAPACLGRPCAAAPGTRAARLHGPLAPTRPSAWAALLLGRIWPADQARVRGPSQAVGPLVL